MTDKPIIPPPLRPREPAIPPPPRQPEIPRPPRQPEVLTLFLWGLSLIPAELESATGSEALAVAQKCRVYLGERYRVPKSEP